MRAIIVKELIENVKWLPIGIAMVGCCVWLVIPFALLSAVNFSSDQLAGAVGLGASLFAVCLAILQSAFDLSARQSGFLFHRAVSRNQIFYAKMVSGAILYCVAVLIPLLVVAVWFYFQGPRFMPVHPIQVVPALFMVPAGFVLHPATMSVFERQANWFGTKLFPVIPAVVVPFLCGILSDISLNFSSYEPRAFLWINTAILTLCVLAILSVARFDLVRKWQLTVSAIVVATAFSISLAIFVDSMSTKDREYVMVNFGVDSDGQLWVYRSKNVYDEEKGHSELRPVTGDRIRPNTTADIFGRLPDDFQPRNLSYWINLNQISQRNSFGPDRETNRQLVYDVNRGLTLIYQTLPKTELVGYISKDGLHSANDVPLRRFRRSPYSTADLLYSLNNSAQRSDGTWTVQRRNDGMPIVWIDTDGIYQVDAKTRASQPILALPITAYCINEYDRQSPPVVGIQSGDRFRFYGFSAESGDADWFKKLQVDSRIPMPKLKLTQIADLPIPEFAKNAAWQSRIGATTDGKYVLAAGNNFATIDSRSGSQWTVEKLAITHEPPQVFNSNYVMGTIPAIVLVVFFLFLLIVAIQTGEFSTFLATDLPPEPMRVPILIIAITTAVVSAIIAAWLCQRRSLSSRKTMIWTMGSLLLGAAGPLMIAAMYRRSLFESCPRCDTKRDIARSKCPSCNSPWEQLPSQGIEIFEVPATSLTVPV